jgi:hypothetical protein
MRASFPSVSLVDSTGEMGWARTTSRAATVATAKAAAATDSALSVRTPARRPWARKTNTPLAAEPNRAREMARNAKW